MPLPLAARPPMRNQSRMAILSDKWIREAATTRGMIEPFTEAQRREGNISYGLSSFGYDARVADEFKIFTNIDSAVVDPKDFASNSFVDKQTDCCIIPPNRIGRSGSISSEHDRSKDRMLSATVGSPSDQRMLHATLELPSKPRQQPTMHARTTPWTQTRTLLEHSGFLKRSSPAASPKLGLSNHPSM